MLVVQASQRWRPEDQEFKVMLHYSSFLYQSELHENLSYEKQINNNKTPAKLKKNISKNKKLGEFIIKI